MKNSIYAFCFLIVLFCCSCISKKSNSEESKLVGKWQLKNSYSPDLKTIINSLTISVKKPKNYQGVLLGYENFNFFPPEQDSVKAYDDFSEKERIYEFNSDGNFKIINLIDRNENIQAKSDPMAYIYRGKWKLISPGNVELDYNDNDYLECCVIESDWERLKSNKTELYTRKKLPFLYNKISNDSLYVIENVYENNAKNYKSIKHIYLKKK